MAETKNNSKTTTQLNNSKKKTTSLKQSVLIKKIMFSTIIAVAILTVALLYIRTVFNKIMKGKIQYLSYDNKINDIVAEERELERKDALTKVYIDIWKNDITDEQKSLKGIDMEKIRTIITKLGNDNYLTNLTVSLSLPANVNIPKNSVNVSNTEISIKFNCLSEYSVYNFLKQLELYKQGFFIIESVSMTKLKNIDKVLINSLLTGTLVGIFEANIKIQWYNFVGK